MRNTLYKLSPFTKARLILTGWYMLILFLILFAFSIALSVTYHNDVTRIVLRQDFGNHVPNKLTHRETRLVLAQVKALRKTSTLDLVIIDFITLLFGGALSYFLAGKTLSPIQKSIYGQRLFVADASHELKNPVATIQSACEVVFRSKHKTLKDYKEALELVHSQSLRLGKLINDLLALSVLDAGTDKELNLCNLSAIAEEAVKSLHPLIIKSQIQLKQSIIPHVHVMGDQESIQKLVIILLDNAIKFTPKNGIISVVVKNRPTPSISVKDTGAGITKKDLENIFRRFYQSDSSHTGSGAGLGLSIAESIMQLHKGKITVQSEVGKGSEFTCTFPKLNT